jgi:hypothetical protein
VNATVLLKKEEKVRIHENTMKAYGELFLDMNMEKTNKIYKAMLMMRNIFK